MTPADRHLTVLNELLRVMTMGHTVARRNNQHAKAELCAERADALSWIIAETAHGVDENIAV